MRYGRSLVDHWQPQRYLQAESLVAWLKTWLTDETLTDLANWRR
jgi:hypothetical protein